jgi:hypothetical protein
MSNQIETPLTDRFFDEILGYAQRENEAASKEVLASYIAVEIKLSDLGYELNILVDGYAGRSLLHSEILPFFMAAEAVDFLLANCPNWYWFWRTLSKIIERKSSGSGKITLSEVRAAFRSEQSAAEKSMGYKKRTLEDFSEDEIARVLSSRVFLLAYTNGIPVLRRNPVLFCDLSI